MNFYKIKRYIIDKVTRIKRRLGRKSGQFIFEDENKLVCYRCYSGELQTLKAVDKKPDTPLSIDILQKPGFVKVAGKVFDMRKEGVYRFYRLPEISEQRVVCSESVNSALATIGYLFAYGNRDDGKHVNLLFDKLTSNRVIGSCETLALVVKEFLSRLNISSRVAVLMTLKTWAGQDDGHTLLEIQEKDNSWFLYDPSFGVCFQLLEKRLSLRDFSRVEDKKSLTIEMLAGNGGYNSFESNNYNYDFWIAERFISRDRLKDWYSRIGQLCLLADVDGLYCSSNSIAKFDEERISSRYKILSDAQFTKKFY